MLKSSLAERDNPFRPGGTLDREAVEMIRSSTFSRSLVIIKDPAASRHNSIIEDDDVGPVKPHRAVLVHFQSPIKSSPHVPLRRNCSRDPDDEDDDEDEEEEEEEVEEHEGLVVSAERNSRLDNNNHLQSPERTSKGGGSSNTQPSPARLNGKARHHHNGIEEGEVVAQPGSGASDAPQPGSQVEHVRLAKRRKCCDIM